MSFPRSYLFVPGDRADRFAKAATSGADEVIFDLEDAVGPEMKAAARANVSDWFAQGGRGTVRINGGDTPWHQEDLAAFHVLPGATVMVPKAEPRVLRQVADALQGTPLIALIESAAGLGAARVSAGLVGVSRLAFGNLDFGADLRIPGTGSVLDPARFEIVLASRLGDLPPPIDGVTTDLTEPRVIADDIQRARDIGFGAKLCIHPAQVAAVNVGFAPTVVEIAWAQRVIAALDAAAGSVVQVEGKMVDRPLIERAQQILQGVDLAAS